MLLLPVILLLISAGKGPVPLPDFQVMNLQNNSLINKASLRGKVVLFNFWTIDKSGLEQQSALKQLSEKYPDKLYIVSACITGKDKSEIYKMAQENGWEFALTKASRGFKDYAYLKEYPYTFVIDPTGFIQSLALGSQSADSLEKMFKPLLTNAVNAPVSPVLPDPGKKTNPKPKKNNEPEILLYGRPQCMNCKAMRGHLENEGLKYLDINIDSDNMANVTMWNKLKTFNLASSRVVLPVMQVNGFMLVNPTIWQVKAALTNSAPGKIRFTKTEKMDLEDPKVPNSKFYTWTPFQSDSIMTGITVYYSEKGVYGIMPASTQVYDEKTLVSEAVTINPLYGGRYGKVLSLQKPGYYVAGLRFCEVSEKDTVYIKKLAVIWKKWGDPHSSTTMSPYVGADSDEGSCVEMQAPAGQYITGLQVYCTENLLNRFSLILSGEE